MKYPEGGMVCCGCAGIPRIDNMASLTVDLEHFSEPQTALKD